MVLFQAAMAMRPLSFVLPVMLLLTLASAQNTNMLWYYCNGVTFPLSDQFYVTLLTLLVALEDDTGYDNWFLQMSVPGNGGTTTAYGQASCNSALYLPDECKACLYNLVNDYMFRICGLAIGAQFQLVDCYLRYEQYQFF